MRYYGRSEISEEDLEKALLVGMSPHERRRLQKKRGIALKHSAQRIFPDAEHQNGACSTDTLTVANSSIGMCGVVDFLLIHSFCKQQNVIHRGWKVSTSSGHSF